jgi:perosamine synthetase
MFAPSIIETEIAQEPRSPGKPAPAGVIPIAVPELSGREWSYVKECLDTNWVSSAGPFVERFEREMAEVSGSRFGVAVSSGTAAIHTALMVAGIQPNDEVLVSTFGFVAPANAINYCGAHPVFIDADPDHWQMDPSLVRRFLEKECQVKKGRLLNKRTQREVRAIMPVHVLGHPCDMDALVELARRFELCLIEDAAESLGATYKKRPIGGLGDLGCFSFNGNKVITSGGGGMLVCNDPLLAKKARHLTTQAKVDDNRFTHDQVGFNYRLTNIQAALGCAQLEQLNSFVEKKRKIAKTYAEHLEGVDGIALMPQAPWARSSYWMYTLLVFKRQFGIDSHSLVDALAKDGICAQTRWQPLHQTQAHCHSQRVLSGVADRLYHQALSLPCSVGLDLSLVEWIADRIRKISRSS